jgi:hypothetical protein
MSDARRDAEAQATRAWLKLGAIAAIVVLTGLWSFASNVGGERLGEEDSGLFGPCLLAGVVLAAGTGFLFHRWSHGQALPLSGIVAAAMILPWASTAYGMAKWWNGFAVEDEEQPIDCILTGKRRDQTKQGAQGWAYRYRCNVEGGLNLDGSAHDYGAIPVAAESGEPVRITAVRGRLGIWLRRSDLTTPPRP